MIFRVIGAVLIVASTTAMGFSIAASNKKEEHALRQLLRALEFMSCELEFRMPALPELCGSAATQATGPVRELFLALQSKLMEQNTVDVPSCLIWAEKEVTKLPEGVLRNMRHLAKCMGRFDLQGQLSGIRSVAELCMRDLKGLQNNQEVRLRSYRTLGICAGIALVILFI